MRKKSKWKKKRKIWLDCRSRKLVSKKRRKRRSKKGHKIQFILPEHFSLTGNPEETMSSIKELFVLLEKVVRGSHIFIDSRKVKIVTVEALIYLIASLQNNRVCTTKKIVCTGNYPRDKEARKIFLTSGFTNYVRSKVKSLPRSNEKMTIKSGLQTAPEIAMQCCMFTRVQRTQTMSLYKILIELMSNAFLHAYDGKTSAKKKWYVYAEHGNDRIRFIFVDTGFGIANTVKKNFKEKVQQLFGKMLRLGIAINDAQLIQSAFNGDFRTSTNQDNRGNGLVTVKNVMSQTPFTNFEVISGHGRYSIPDHSINYRNEIYGTLFTFDLKEEFL